MNQFTEDNEKRSAKIKQELMEQIDLLKRKMVVQQNTGSNSSN